MKRDKIIYWITTGLVTAGMLLSAFMYLSSNPELMQAFKSLSIPTYFVMMLGVTKLLGAIVLIAPVWNELKEWVYAGFTFMFTGAVWTHLATGTSWMSPLLFLLLLAISYVFHRRIAQSKIKV